MIFEGKVLRVAFIGRAIVQLQNGTEASCVLSRGLKWESLAIGDRVLVELSPVDPQMGRILDEALLSEFGETNGGEPS